jgi:hypothetical protein
MSTRDLNDTGPVPPIDFDFDPMTRTYHQPGTGPRYAVLPSPVAVAEVMRRAAREVFAISPEARMLAAAGLRSDFERLLEQIVDRAGREVSEVLTAALTDRKA